MFSKESFVNEETQQDSSCVSKGLGKQINEKNVVFLKKNSYRNSTKLLFEQNLPYICCFDF